MRIFVPVCVDSIFNTLLRYALTSHTHTTFHLIDSRLARRPSTSVGRSVGLCCCFCTPRFFYITIFDQRRGSRDCVAGKWPSCRRAAAWSEPIFWVRFRDEPPGGTSDRPPTHRIAPSRHDDNDTRTKLAALRCETVCFFVASKGDCVVALSSL